MSHYELDERTEEVGRVDGHKGPAQIVGDRSHDTRLGSTGRAEQNA